MKKKQNPVDDNMVSFRFDIKLRADSPRLPGVYAAVLALIVAAEGEEGAKSVLDEMVEKSGSRGDERGEIVVRRKATEPAQTASGQSAASGNKGKKS